MHSEAHAEKRRIGFSPSRAETASANVYLPSFRNRRGKKKNNNRHASRITYRVDKPIKAAARNQSRQPKKCASGHKVTRDRKAILKAGYFTAGRIKVVCRMSASRSPPGNTEGRENEDEKE